MAFFIRKIHPLLRYCLLVLLMLITTSCSLSRFAANAVWQQQTGEISEKSDTPENPPEQIPGADGISQKNNEAENDETENDEDFSEIDDLRLYAERLGIPFEDVEDVQPEIQDVRIYAEQPGDMPADITDIPLPQPARAYNKPVTHQRKKDEPELKFYSKNPDIAHEGAENKDLMKVIASWIGAPYKWGGCGKDGVDCSCFVQTVYREVYGISLSRNSGAMFDNDLIPADKENLREGDIISFKMKDDRISHIGIYLKNNRFVHVSRKKGVVISSLDRPYFQKRFYSAGRAVKEANWHIARKSAPASAMSRKEPMLISRTDKRVKLSDLVVVKQRN
jgi:cell wall-associated NlpC family hydrolase